MFCFIVQYISLWIQSYLNKRKNPYISTHMPMTGHPNNTIRIPPTKKLVAFNLCFWKKNLNVLSSPITNASPHMKSIWKNKVKLFKIYKYAFVTQKLILKHAKMGWSNTDTGHHYHPNHHLKNYIKNFSQKVFCYFEHI